MKRKKNIDIIFGATKGIGLSIFKKVISCKKNKVITFGRSKIKSTDSKRHIHFRGNVICESGLSDLLNYLKLKNLKIDNMIITIGKSKSKNPGYENFNDIIEMFEINFFSNLKIIYKLIPFMNKKSKIICISSIASDPRLEAPIGYACAKSALNNFIKNFSKSYKKRKISICGILPGHTMHTTSVWKYKMKNKKNLTKSFINRASSNSKFCTSEQISDVIINLLNIESEIINGSLINCENGVTLN